MPSLEAKRTLVKSPPEIWAEVSDAGALARHLGEFGEIRITRTQPESLVEWEGEKASGCVRLEPSGWGTKVTLTADAPDPGSDLAIADPGSDLAIEHDAGLQDLTPPRATPPRATPPRVTPPRGAWWSRFRRRREPEPVQALAPVLDGERAQAALTGVLDTLGAAHHRPFSRP